MKRSSLARWPCSIARTMDLVGDWWTPLVLRESFYGIRRFDDFQRTLGLARNTLTERLNRLVAEGLLEKQAYQDKPARYEYVLTGKGRDFFAVLMAMTRWGDKWLSGADGPPVAMRHDACGHEAHAEVVCSECGEPLASQDVTMRLGPGYPERLRTLPEVTRRFTQT